MIFVYTFIEVYMRIALISLCLLLSKLAYAQDCVIDVNINAWYNDTNRTILRDKGITGVFTNKDVDYIVKSSDVVESTQTCRLLCNYNEKRRITLQVTNSDGVVLAERTTTYKKFYPENQGTNESFKSMAVESLMHKIPSCKKIRKLESDII